MKNIIKNLKFKRKAIAFLAKAKFFGDPGNDFKIIGVTGTNGKTTTATLLYQITLALGYRVGQIGTTGIYINGKKINFDQKIPTTPDPLGLRKIFKLMKKEKVKYVFMEVSSHAMDQDRVAGITFTGGIFTNLTHDHLDYHDSFAEYFKAKKKFFDILPKGAFALSNTDDEHGPLIYENTKAKKYSYGFMGGESFHGELFKADFSGIYARFNGENIYSKLLGKFNAYNLLAVFSTCFILKFPVHKVVMLLEDIKAPEGRFEYFTKNNITVIVDYAHSPDSLEKAILTAKNIKNEESKLITVFGCGGDRDKLKRRVMGKIGVTLSDIAILTSDNPRYEDPDKILEEMKTDLSMPELKKTYTISDRKEAISKSIEIAKAGDIILCAGKGHEDYQEIRGVKNHFNDLEEYKKILK